MGIAAIAMECMAVAPPEPGSWPKAPPGCRFILYPVRSHLTETETTAIYTWMLPAIFLPGPLAPARPLQAGGNYSLLPKNQRSQTRSVLNPELLGLSPGFVTLLKRV